VSVLVEASIKNCGAGTNHRRREGVCVVCAWVGGCVQVCSRVGVCKCVLPSFLPSDYQVEPMLKLTHMCSSFLPPLGLPSRR